MNSLEELYQLLNVDGIDIDTIELAESLWLSQYISKTVVTSSIDIDTSTILDNKPINQNDNPSPTENESPKNTQKVKQSNQQKRKDIPLHPIGDENSKNSLPFRTPLVRKLYKDNDLIYAFRHFRQKIVSLEQLKLDEEKTADYMSKTDIFRPFYKKSYEKRFNILFMVDISESMKIWENLIEEFVKDVKNYHIFKKVTVYYISTDKDTPQLFKKKENISKLNSKWYKHTEQNTLTFVFSDMVAKSWSSGELLSEITQWQRYLHLAIVQMLPQRLWNGTKLIDASMGKMSNSKKFLLNNKIQSRAEEILASEEDSLPELVKIPILNFNESSIDAYGRVINALSNNRIEGALFEREDFQGKYQFSESNINIEAKDKLRNFYKYASTTSKELLELLAIVPLSLPIIKLVQQKLLPQSSQEHLSEVFMSSIIDKEQKIDGFYQFNKVSNEQNGVREELIKKIGAKKAFQTIVKLSEIIHSQGGIFDFLAYVVDPTTLRQSNEFNEIDREFARISVTVLNEMGVKYKELADRLQEGYIYNDNMSIINNIKIKLVSKPLKSIRLVGVGGGGNNLIEFMIQQGSYNNIDLIAVNTDAAILEASSAPYKIQIGVELVKGLDAGMKPSIGKESALESYNEIRTALAGADIVFISAGLGGGTGTGAAPVIAQIAKEVGALTIPIVTKPFTSEGIKRLKLAEEGLQELKKESDSIVVIPNDKLLSIIDKKLGIKESFKIVDGVLAQAVSGISGLILSSGDNDINLDFVDLQTVMSHRGMALMGVGEYEGENAAYEAIKAAIEFPLLDNMSIDGAMGVLVHFKMHPNFPMIEISEAMMVVQGSAHEDADVIFGTTTDESLPENYIKITIITTGFEKDLTNNQDFVGETPATEKVKVRPRLGEHFDADYLDIPAYLRQQHIDDEPVQKEEPLITKEDANIKVITSDITFECEECGQKYFAECAELDWEQVGGSERGMGTEIEYEAQYYKTCHKCHNEMSITFSCWEYPIGAENYRDTSSNGIANLRGNCCSELNTSDEGYAEDYDEFMINEDIYYSTLEEKIEELEIFINNLIPFAELAYRYNSKSLIYKDVEVHSNNFLISREFDNRYLYDLIEEIREDVNEVKLAIYEDTLNDNMLLLKKQYKIESEYISETYGVNINCEVFLEDNDQILYIYPLNEIELVQEEGFDINQVDAEMEMEDWFYENYDNPVNFLPDETGEGGYQYLYGGPYELDEILYEQFGEKYSNYYIQNVIENLESEHGDIAWGKKPSENNEYVDDYVEKGYAESILDSKVNSYTKQKTYIPVNIHREDDIYKSSGNHRGTSNIIKAKIDGNFEGWSGESIIKLTDGEIWKQAEYYYQYLYSYMPNVTIADTLSGYKMKVDGINKEVLVEKLENLIESKIDGEFNGWDGNTTVKLTNGERWKQSAYKYSYSYAYNPNVIIYQLNNRFKMKVDGNSAIVDVEEVI